MMNISDKWIGRRQSHCPIPGIIQGQVVEGSEQPDLVSGIPVHGRDYVIFKVPSNPNHFTILWFILVYKKYV